MSPLLSRNKSLDVHELTCCWKIPSEDVSPLCRAANVRVLWVGQLGPSVNNAVSQACVSSPKGCLKKVYILTCAELASICQFMSLAGVAGLASTCRTVT